MMETLNQRPSTSAVPIDNNVHQLTLTCISILHTIANTILKSLIHDSSPLSAWGAMALKVSEFQFPSSSGRCANYTTAHTF